MHPQQTTGRPGVRQSPPLCQNELWARARALAGHTLGELAQALGATLPDDVARLAPHTKGFVGRLIEDALGADVDAGERPDFVRLGIELKTVPVRAVPRAETALGPLLVPQQSPFVCSIDMLEAQQACWAQSRLRSRLACVLIVPVAAKDVEPRWAHRTIFAPRLWSPDATAWEQIRADWELLMGAIGAGQAERLSARLGEIVQVRPKAAHSGVRTLSWEGCAPALTKPLGFYLRRRFLAQIFAQGVAAKASISQRV